MTRLDREAITSSANRLYNKLLADMQICKWGRRFETLIVLLRSEAAATRCRAPVSKLTPRSVCEFTP